MDSNIIKTALNHLSSTRTWFRDYANYGVEDTDATRNAYGSWGRAMAALDVLASLDLPLDLKQKVNNASDALTLIWEGCLSVRNPLSQEHCSKWCELSKELGKDLISYANAAPTPFKADLNDQITFRLTPYGSEIMIDQYRGMSEDFRQQCLEKVKATDSNECKMLIWEFAQIFGPHLYNGCPRDKMVLVDTNVTIRRMT